MPPNTDPLAVHLPIPIELAEIKQEIQNYRLRGQYILGHDYICKLPQSTRRVRPIAIDIAQLYLVQGHYIRAAEACALAYSYDDMEQNQVSPDALDADSICLELISAYVDISRHGRMKSALITSQRAYDAWLSRIAYGGRDQIINDAIISESQVYTYSRFGWEVFTGYQADNSTEQILIEFYYHKIRVVASDQSLLDETITRKLAADRLDVLRAHCIKECRFREARFLTYSRIRLLNSREEDEAILTHLLEALAGTHHPLEQAQTHLDLANCLLSYPSENAKAFHFHIAKSRALFVDTNHGFGLTDLLDLELTKESDSLSQEELLRRKLGIAELYFEAQCYQQGIRCLMFSIQVSLDMDSLHSQTQRNLERLEMEVTKVGGELLLQAVYIHGICQALVRAPEYGYALKSLEAYLESPPIEIGPKNHGLLIQSLALAYFNLGNTSEAVACAKKALDVFSAGASYVDKSDAALCLSVFTTEHARKSACTFGDRLRQSKEATEILQCWADLDRENDYPDGECDKCLRLALEHYSFGFSTDSEAIDKASKWLFRAKQCKPSCTVAISPSAMVEVEIADHMSRGHYEQALDCATKLVETCRTLPQVSPFTLGQATLRVSNVLYKHVIHCIELEGTKSAEEWQFIFQEIQQSQRIAWDAMKFYRAAGGSESIVSCANYIGSLIQHVRSFRPDWGKDLLRGFLPELEKIELFCDSIRRSTASSNNLRSLLEKRDIVSNSAHRKLYTYAVQSCLQLGEPSSAWIWTQKGKARALSDLFGVRALMPDTLLKAIQDDPASQKLYEQERLNIERTIQATPEGYIGAARKAETVRTQMKSIPLLANMLEIREGAFSLGFEAQSFDAALDMTKIGQEAVKYIDWFVTSEKIVLLVRKLDGTTYYKDLSITVHEVEIWVKEAFDGRKEAEPPLRRGDGNRFLSKLNKLVDGLEHYTEEDDLLILSPSGLLNRVPLHGLNVDGRRLIDRNLIIYSSNAAVLRQCHSRASFQATQNHTVSHNAMFLGVYEDAKFLNERAVVFQSMEKLSKQFHGEAKCGPRVTKPIFQDCSEKVRWLHYHGHAVYAKEDVLNSGLILSDGNEIVQSHPGSFPIQLETKDVSVPEIFDLDMTRNAPHYTIIACDSSTQDIAPGDEPLGLIPALLYAGASSVLGCMWPTPSPAGRVFSEIFHDYLQEQVKYQQDGSGFYVLNLAAALRDAVREMAKTKGTTAPYFWAPFVLHGAWFHVLHS